MAAILLIHGALKLNRHLLIYWICVAVIRIILQSVLLVEVFFFNVLEFESIGALYKTLELLEVGSCLKNLLN